MEELKKLVINEAKSIKAHATRDEKDKLDFGSLIPSDASLCIYGQMAGGCFSPRANELIKKCSNVFFEVIVDSFNPIEDINFDDIVSDDFKDSSGYGRNFSAIEFYITTPNANNEGLVAFIKGEKDILIL